MIPAGKIKDIRVFRLKVPLSSPYHLSFGRLDYFDLLLVRVLVEGREGIGETTPLYGYSHETVELVWRLLRGWTGELLGLSTEEALLSLRSARGEYPFAVTAMVTAIETALQPPKLRADTEIPLLGTVMTDHRDEPDEEIEALLREGYTTLKVKVGWDGREDAARVRHAQEIVGDRAQIRLDANQAYDLEQATYLARHVDPGNIELFEQPFGIGAWDAIARLSEVSPLPLMLDESITSEAALEKAIRSRCAQVVKFKLMKAGGLGELERLILRAKEAGLKVVLGNGVAGDIGNFHELIVAGRHIETAGEMNGFLKQEQRMLSNPYEVSQGKVTLPRGYVPQVDWRKVEAYAVESTPAKSLP